MVDNKAKLESMLARLKRLLIVPNLPPETRARYEESKLIIVKALMIRAALTGDLEGVTPTTKGPPSTEGFNATTQDPSTKPTKASKEYSKALKK